MSKSISRRAMLAGAAILLMGHGSAPAQTNTYPTRTIKIVVPLPPGSGPDVLARMLADKLSVKFSQPVIVENRPGGSANIGAQAVANAAPDGYTLLLTPAGPLVFNEYLFANLGFDPHAFAPVSFVTNSTFVLVGRADLPFSTIPELIAYAKANPDKLNFANGGRASAQELMVEMIKEKAGIRMVSIPYPGVNVAMTDILGGRIDLLLLDLANVQAHIQSGKLKAIGVTSEKRLPDLPNTPAIAETLPGFSATVKGFIVAPPKTPADVTKTLSEAITEVLRLPDVTSKLNVMAMPPIGTSPEETTKIIADERVHWHNVIEAAQMKPE